MIAYIRVGYNRMKSRNKSQHTSALLEKTKRDVLSKQKKFTTDTEKNIAQLEEQAKKVIRYVDRISNTYEAISTILDEAQKDRDEDTGESYYMLSEKDMKSLLKSLKEVSSLSRKKQKEDEQVRSAAQVVVEEKKML